MIRNYILSAWRNMMRSKLYTFINIFCLSIGITGAIFIAMFLDHENSYDQHHDNHDRIYRMEGRYLIGGSTTHMALTAFPLGPALKLEFGQVKEYVRFFAQSEQVVRIGERDFLEDDFYYADSTVFEVFSHKFVHGNPAGSLTEPHTIVITQSLSQKYFGDSYPIDQTIEINRENFRVTAVVEDLPSNSHLKFKGLMSMITRDNDVVYSLSPQLFWNINTNYTYIQLYPGSDIENLLGNMESFNQKYVAPVGEILGAGVVFEATPLRKTHFKKIQAGLPTGNKANLLIFSIVAVFLVVIAAVNYTNLATARASKRAREIAMRKVCGASRTQLVAQFLSESIIVSVISLLLSLLIVELFLPGFNQLTNGSYGLRNILNIYMFSQVLAITLFTGIISGIYPAVYLSNLKPVSILKGNHTMNGGSGVLRKTLVIFQFAVSVLLIAGTLTVQRQIDYLQKKDLGFTRENRIVITITESDIREKTKALEAAILQHPDVVNTSIALSVPGRGFNKNAIRVQSGDEMVESAISTNFIDHNFLDLFNIPLIKGRNFDREMVSDAQQSVLVNQTAVEFFGWDDPLGKTIQWQFNQEGEPQMTVKVIGVFADYNFSPLQNPIEPLMMLLVSEPVFHRSLIIEHTPGAHNQLMEFLTPLVREFNPGSIPNIFQLDYGFRGEFDSEESLAGIFGLFALVCILISFLGLFGLSSYLTDQRKKEIGVRKVLGSSGWSILAMFYKEFSGLVLVAIIIAGPVTWFLMERWLQEFVYSISMDVQPIFVSAFIALMVAIITVSYHTFRASQLNPVDAIRAD
jgi:putative ABC transport system permease protein